MMSITIDHAARNLIVAILSPLLTALMIVLVFLFRRRTMSRLLLMINSYYVLLISLFIAGLLIDDGYGVAFIPCLIATFPSVFLIPILAQTSLIHFFEGYWGNFTLIVIVCGGLNSLAFYRIAKAVGRGHRPPEKIIESKLKNFEI